MKYIKLAKILVVIIFTILSSNKLISNETTDSIEKLIKYTNEICSSNHLRASFLCDSILELCKKANFKNGEAAITRIKGLAHFYNVKYSDALKLFIESKEKFEQIKDSVGIFMANNNIAIVYDYLGLAEISLEKHKENLLLSEKINDYNCISTSLNNIGVAYRDKKMYDSSNYYYKRAIEMASKFNDPKSLSLFYNNLGLSYLDINNYDSSKKYLDLSLEIRLKINEIQGIKNSYQGLGEYYYKKENYKEARKFQEKSLDYAFEIGIPYEIESINEDLAQTYEKLGLYELAYKAAILNKKMHDSADFNNALIKVKEIELEKALSVEQKIKDLKDLEIKYERDSKIQLLFIILGMIATFFVVVISMIKIRKDNKLLIEQKKEIIYQKEEIANQNIEMIKQNEVLEKINSEKDMFFSIIAHDLKSPFSGFLGLTKILTEETLSKDEILATGKSLRESAISLYKLLENLLEWSRMQRGVIEFNPEICFLEYLVVQNINIQSEVAKQKEIIINNSIEPGTTCTCDIPMLNTIIRNLLSNALKFTPRGGFIEIGSKSLNNSDFIELWVKDTGIGIDQETQMKLFKIDQKVSKPGTENEPSSGLGLLLCKEFVEKNGGKIRVESENGKGTKFKIELPK